MKEIKHLKEVLVKRKEYFIRNKEKLSILSNQDLLEKRKNTILREGCVLSVEEEESFLKGVKSAVGFMGIIPLRSKLGEYYFLYLDDDIVGEYLFWFGSFGYERSSAVLFTHLAMEASYVLDLGSYSGYFSILSSVLAKNANTYAIEANPLNFQRLCENLRINGANARPCFSALKPSHDDNKSIEIFYNAGLRVLDTGSFAKHESAEIIPQKLNKKNAFTVPAISFSCLIEKCSIRDNKNHNSNALIKLDIEGLEVPLLEDIFNFYSDSNFIVFVEILTITSYRNILSIVNSRNDMKMVYINEHKQKIKFCNHSNYGRQKGSRNFIIGNKLTIEKIFNMSLSDLFFRYE